MSYVMGIDPGLYGAIAVFRPETGRVVTFDMPTRLVTVNGNQRRRLDLPALANWFRLHAPRQEECYAVVEEPHSMPGQGVVSSFTFGFVCGVAQMAVASHGLEITLVDPAVWKKALGVTKDKNTSRRLASELFPSAADQWAREKDDGRAEAALIAYYGSIQ